MGDSFSFSFSFSCSFAFSFSVCFFFFFPLRPRFEPPGSFGAASFTSFGVQNGHWRSPKGVRVHCRAPWRPFGTAKAPSKVPHRQHHQKPNVFVRFLRPPGAKGRQQAALAAPRSRLSRNSIFVKRTRSGDPHAGPSGVGGFPRPAATAADPRKTSLA